MLLKWDPTCSVMPVETSSGRSPSGCIIQQSSFTSPREKGTVEYLKDRFDFLFKVYICGWGGKKEEEEEKKRNGDSASRCSLDGHQGNLPSFFEPIYGTSWPSHWGTFWKNVLIRVPFDCDTGLRDY